MDNGHTMYIFGFFAGIFVGCLALAIAEMLNTIPVLREGSSSGMDWELQFCPLDWESLLAV